ncbi:hypothetical protein N9H78_01145 [Winogradskyella sp.]|nr:hypothetical protein [Winogradskyella sp.]MDA8874261.1 hypothetical protein [Winogradskyella sp.]
MKCLSKDSRSELISSIVHNYKHNYDFIGKTSPKEAQLETELKTVEKQNRKLSLSLENAEHQIEIEQKINKAHDKEQLTLNKNIFDLKNELKAAESEIKKLTERLNSSSYPKKGTQNSQLLYGSLASLVLSGLSLIVMPKLFNQ